MKDAHFQKLRKGFGYPDVASFIGVDWFDLPDDYSPTEYTASSVKSSVPNWEDPDLDAVWYRAQRLSAAGRLLIRDSVTGRPLNPNGPTGVSGYGRLWSYGPNFSADGIVVHQNSVLLIERSDTAQLAFPGGYREFCEETGEYESPVLAALREVHEETNLNLKGEARIIAQGIPRFVIRNTDNAWIEDCAVLIDASDTPKEMLIPTAGDDAVPGSARWVPLSEVDQSKMSPRHAEHIRRLQT